MRKPIGSFNLLFCSHDLVPIYNSDYYVKRFRRWKTMKIYKCNKCGLVKKINAEY